MLKISVFGCSVEVAVYIICYRFLSERKTMQCFKETGCVLKRFEPWLKSVCEWQGCCMAADFHSVPWIWKRICQPYDANTVLKAVQPLGLLVGLFLNYAVVFISVFHISGILT